MPSRSLTNYHLPVREQVVSLVDDAPKVPLILERLQSLTLEGYSDVITRIEAPNLRDIMIKTIISFQERTVTSSKTPSTHQRLYRGNLFQFIACHASSLQSLQIFQPLVVKAYSPTIFLRIFFPKLTWVIIACGETLGEHCFAPKLNRLEIRPPTSDGYSHHGIQGFRAVENLVLASVDLEFRGLFAALAALDNVKTLHILADPDVGCGWHFDGASRLLTRLSSPDHPWIFPLLEAIHITFKPQTDIEGLTHLGLVFGSDRVLDYDKDLPYETEEVSSANTFLSVSEWSDTEDAGEGEDDDDDDSDSEAGGEKLPHTEAIDSEDGAGVHLAETDEKKDDDGSHSEDSDLDSIQSVHRRGNFRKYFAALRVILLNRSSDRHCVDIEEIKLYREKEYGGMNCYALEGTRRARWFARHVPRFSIMDSNVV